MARIVLISCVKSKLPHKARAEDLYVSQLFKGCLRKAKLLSPDGIYILSSKYGLLSLDEEVEPYELTLKDMSDEEVRKWAGGVIPQLREVSDLCNDEFIFLAGIRYRKYLIPHITNYSVPMQGLGIGKQLAYLK